MTSTKKMTSKDSTLLYKENQSLKQENAQLLSKIKELQDENEDTKNHYRRIIEVQNEKIKKLKMQIDILNLRVFEGGMAKKAIQKPRTLKVESSRKQKENKNFCHTIKIPMKDDIKQDKKENRHAIKISMKDDIKQDKKENRVPALEPIQQFNDDIKEGPGYLNTLEQTEQDMIDQLYPNPDRMTYEQLLQLENNVGNVSRGLSEKQIEILPVSHYLKSNFDEKDCVICQESFKTLEKIKKLPCSHIFHVICIDTWLRQEKKCPFCNKEVK